MAIKKKTTEEPKEEAKAETASDTPVKTEKEKLLELYQTLKDLGINSIGDLEQKIARAE